MYFPFAHTFIYSEIPMRYGLECSFDGLVFMEGGSDCDESVRLVAQV